MTFNEYGHYFLISVKFAFYIRTSGSWNPIQMITSLTILATIFTLPAICLFYYYVYLCVFFSLYLVHLVLVCINVLVINNASIIYLVIYYIEITIYIIYYIINYVYIHNILYNKLCVYT